MTSVEGLSAQISVLLTMASVVEIRELKSLTREIKNTIAAKMESTGVPVLCAQALWLLGRCCCQQDAKDTRDINTVMSTILNSFVTVLERCHDALVQNKDRAKGMLSVCTCVCACISRCLIVCFKLVDNNRQLT